MRSGHVPRNDRSRSPEYAPELEAEVTKLRKELAEARMERDIVKKAAAYFARESLPSTRS